MAETIIRSGYSINPAASTRRVKTGLMVYLGEKIFSVNEIGAIVIKSVGDGKGIEQITKSIALEYNADITAVTIDVRSFIASMLENKVLIEK